jgi:hypothetical protein
MSADRPSVPVTWCEVTVYGTCGAVVDQWPIEGWGAPDLAVVDRLARIRLEATRNGMDVGLTNVCPDLANLLTLVGLNPLAP